MTLSSFLAHAPLSDWYVQTKSRFQIQNIIGEKEILSVIKHNIFRSLWIHGSMDTSMQSL